MDVNKDNARELLIELCKYGVVSWEEMARNFIAAANSETCLWIMQTYDYDLYYEDKDEDEYDEEKEVYGDSVYTMRDWERDGQLKLDLYQFISPNVFYELRDSVPPQSLHGTYFQVGEIYTHKDGIPHYQTFERVGYAKNGEPIYMYVGLKP